jgi:hypothetical protein
MVTPDAFFNRDGEAFVPTPLAQGPWGSTVSGALDAVKQRSRRHKPNG